MTQLIDLTSEFQKVHGGGLGSLDISAADIANAEAAAFSMYGQTHKAMRRADAARFQRSIAQARTFNRSRVDSALKTLTYRNVEAKLKGRADSANSLQAVRDLEYLYADVLEETLPAMTGLDPAFYFQDTSVPAGAQFHTIRRKGYAGEAGVYQAGQNIGNVEVGMKRERLPVRIYAIGFETEIFAGQAASFSPENINEAQEKLRGAREIMARFANKATYFGLPNSGIYGITTFPGLPVYAPSVAFDGTAAPDDVIAELNKIANYGYNESRGALASNAMVTSPRIHSYLFNTPRRDGSDMSIGKWFVENNDRINAITVAPEWQNYEKDGYDGILAYRNDRNGIANVVVQPFTTIAPQLQAFTAKTYCYMKHGGVAMRDAGANCLARVRPPSLV